MAAFEAIVRVPSCGPPFGPSPVAVKSTETTRFAPGAMLAGRAGGATSWNGPASDRPVTLRAWSPELTIRTSPTSFSVTSSVPFCTLFMTMRSGNGTTSGFSIWMAGTAAARPAADRPVSPIASPASPATMRRAMRGLRGLAVSRFTSSCSCVRVSRASPLGTCHAQHGQGRSEARAPTPAHEGRGGQSWARRREGGEGAGAFTLNGHGTSFDGPPGVHP